MSQISLRHLHRGPTTTLIFTIVRLEGDPVSITHDKIITVDNLIQASLKFEYVKCSFVPYVRMKKMEGVYNSPVPVSIQCNDFNELFYCSDHWIEVQLNPLLHTSTGRTNFKCNNTSYSDRTHDVTATCFTIEINVTAQVIMPTGFLPRKELYEDTESTDFQLYTKDGSVAVHKAVLFLHSDMFKMMLTNNWKESNEGQISMDGITVQTLRHLKDYMYLGILPEEGLEPLLQVAAHYFMDKLRADCSAKLVESVNSENIDRLIALGCEFNIPELVRGLIFRIPDNIVNDMNYLQIDKSNDKIDKSNDKIVEEKLEN
ncbi:uncharacterized protein LOC134674425 isoform X2 [Cydia fagiglandana]|uniref:uncharacterized protein LOC134674425 isoform X2 n=1 Tax=Cydia fagiglandana TaxID=1458189 RepID=UPI002FEE2AA0